MNKLAAVALTTLMGVTGIACARAAKADPYLRAEVVLSGPVVAPFVYAPGYYPPYYARGPYGYWHRDYVRDGYEHYRRDHDAERRSYDGDRGHRR